LQYNAVGGRHECNICFSRGHYQSCNQVGEDIKEVMNIVGDCAFESILHQLYVNIEKEKEKGHTDLVKSLSVKGVKFDEANYEGKNRTSGKYHDKNILNIRRLAAKKYKEIMIEKFKTCEEVGPPEQPDELTFDIDELIKNSQLILEEMTEALPKLLPPSCRPTSFNASRAVSVDDLSPDR
jgi:hypothetical protein